METTTIERAGLGPIDLSALGLRHRASDAAIGGGHANLTCGFYLMTCHSFISWIQVQQLTVNSGVTFHSNISVIY